MAPRFSRLASTINRDDIIPVIGASGASSLCGGPAGGRSAFFKVRVMAQDVPIKPPAAKDAERFWKPLTMSSICGPLCQTLKKKGGRRSREATMTITQPDRDLGTAYATKPSSYRKELTEVGPGTPMGELLRRYWHPVGLATDAAHTPRKVRALAEDLILFRDKHGRPGLLRARCCHRGTTLYYGKVEDDGLRCCYHGWKFDRQGRCLEQPCEPEGGLFKDKVRQPWYPVEEC